MINAERRGEIAGAELARVADKHLHRFIWIPPLVVEVLAHWIFRQYKHRGYAHIEPEREFVHGFVERFLRERTILFD